MVVVLKGDCVVLFAWVIVVCCGRRFRVLVGYWFVGECFGCVVGVVWLVLFGWLLRVVVCVVFVVGFGALAVAEVRWLVGCFKV